MKTVVLTNLSGMHLEHRCTSCNDPETEVKNCAPAMWKPSVAIALGGSGVVRDFVAVQDVYIRSRVSPSGDSIHVDMVSPDSVTL